MCLASAVARIHPARSTHHSPKGEMMFVAIDAPGGTVTLEIFGGSRFGRFTANALGGGNIKVTGDPESSTKVEVSGMRHVTLQIDHDHAVNGHVQLSCTADASAWSTRNPDPTLGHIDCGPGQSVEVDVWAN